MRVRAAAAALLLMLCAGVTGCTAGKARPGTLPNQFVPVWSAAAEFNNFAGPAITSTLVVAPRPDGDLAIRDLQTGRLERSIAPDHGLSFSGATVIGKYLYSYMETSAGTVARFAAYDLSTGRSTWHTDLTVEPYGGIGLITPRGIVVQPGTVGLVQGLSLSDGKPTWKTELPASCPGGDSLSTSSAAVFLLCSGSGVRLVTVDPADGQISWERVLAADLADGYDLQVTNQGDIIVQAGNRMRIFTSTGRLIASLPCPSGSCVIGASGPVGVVEFGGTGTTAGQEAGTTVQGIDLSTGHPLWQRTGDLITTGPPPVTTDGTLFALPGQSLVDETSSLLPAFVLVMQASTGHSTILPLPLAGRAVSLVGAAAGLLIVKTQEAGNSFITAFRPEHVAISGPAALSGVTAADWPDACKLLTPADLRFIAAGYISVARPVTLSGVTWSKPVTCAYVGPSNGDPAVILTVAWIAASNQQADELLNSDLMALGNVSSGALVSIPGGYLVYDGAFVGGVDQALIPVGRVIVAVTVPGNPSDARRLAPIVATRLRADYGSG